MRETSRTLSISFRKKDRDYADMLVAICSFYLSKGDMDRGNTSQLIISLLKEHLPSMIEGIRTKYGVDPIELYREYLANTTTKREFFDNRISRARPSSKFTQRILDEAYQETNE